MDCPRLYKRQWAFICLLRTSWLLSGENDGCEIIGPITGELKRLATSERPEFLCYHHRKHRQGVLRKEREEIVLGLW
jgi:hypothetical protein